ncbi:MAG TPA: glycosyltransferase family 4 protein [Polyangiaceae bacterium]|jgi:glycosyltransferase involved in cell wall biosynthesis|nr:glycosyltransferase family 4 protein [Polyangiaceae bacterium]
MQRVVLVSGDFVRTGGMDMPNFAVAQQLAECGVSVQLVAFRVADELTKHSNVQWHKVPKPLRSYFLGLPLLDRVGRSVARKSMARGGRVIVNGGNCQIGDVNWVHYVHAAYEATARVSLVRRAQAALSHRLSVEQERSALLKARTIIANSERTRRDLTDKLGIDDSRIRTIYYGIDPERFSPPSEQRRRSLREQFGLPDRPQVAFVGALGDRRKGFDTLFAAWSSLCRDPSWECDLVVVGRGAELDLWRERARADGIQTRVRFLGFRNDVPDVLAACDALVAPTRYEAYGLGVQEALCTGIPALVSASAGVAERYPSALSELLLDDPSNAAALEASLRNWRHHHERLLDATRHLGAQLRQRTWTTMAQDVQSLID